MCQHSVLWAPQIWVSSPHNATGYYTVYGEEALHADHFSARLSFGDTQTIWARTGYLGFLRRTELTDASGGEGHPGTAAPVLVCGGLCPHRPRVTRVPQHLRRSGRLPAPFAVSSCRELWG